MARGLVLFRRNKEELVSLIEDLQEALCAMELPNDHPLNKDLIYTTLRGQINILKRELSETTEQATEWATRCRKAWSANESLKNEYFAFKDKMLKTRQNAREKPRGEK